VNPNGQSPHPAMRSLTADALRNYQRKKEKKEIDRD
jgi:hypothetical protein